MSPRRRPPVARIVVLADPDAAMRDRYRQALVDADYIVAAVDNGVDAVRRIADLGPDLVVLDLALPGLHVAEVWRGILRQPSRSATPMIILTVDGIRRVDALSAGYLLDFLDRPVAPAVLVAAVDGAIERSMWRSRGPERAH